MKEFNVESGKLIASDPFYSKTDDWYQMTVPVKNGTWLATVNKTNDKISSLIVCHADHYYANPDIIINILKRPMLPYIANTCSGQFGFFDHDAYRNDDVITSDIPLWTYTIEKPGDKFYSACCQQTLGVETWGLLPFGAVSTSGYGDGKYTILGEKNSHGEYIALAVIFIEPNYDDDLDDDDESDDDDNDE